MPSVRPSVTADEYFIPLLCRRPERCRTLIGLVDKSQKSMMASLSQLILKMSWIIQAICLPVTDLFSDRALPSAVVTCFLFCFHCV